MKSILCRPFGTAKLSFKAWQSYKRFYFKKYSQKSFPKSTQFRFIQNKGATILTRSPDETQNSLFLFTNSFFTKNLRRRKEILKFKPNTYICQDFAYSYISNGLFFTKILLPVDRDRRFDSVFSKKVNAGKRRTYFFDVRQTKGDDFFLTLTESTKRFNGDGYERHKIFLYKEDFNRFLTNLEEVITYIKTELMPNYDYEEFDRKHEEWDREDDFHERRPPRQHQNDDRGPRNEADDEIDEDNSQLSQPPRSERFDDDLSW